MKTTSAVAALLGTTLAIASPAQAQTASGATAAAAPVNRMVVFGDSLADGGYYLTLDPRLPRDAGSFTTNPDPVAPEVLAARLGLPLTPVYGQGGTNYAVGGARVTAANALSIPITTQITNFLGAGGTFGPRDLVYVQGGGNDYFAFQAGGSTNNAILTTAATELATQVSRLQSAGAQRIVTLAVQTGGAAGLALFNRTYAAALAAANVNALYFDTDRLFNELVTSPATYGYTNITGVACTVPSSLACTRATLVTPNANETYILADSVHPAGITQRIQGQAIASLVQAPEQIAGLGYAAQAMFRAQRDLLEGPERGGSQRDGRALSVFGGAAYHYYASGNSAQRVGITERGFSGTLGADLAIGAASGVGIAGAYSDGTGDFQNGAGRYKPRAWSASGYARGELGPVRLLADGSYGEIDYRQIQRSVQLGPTIRTHDGETDGNYVAGRITGALDLVRTGGLAFGPDLAVQYDRVRLAGYAEAGGLSTAAAFGRQQIESLTGRFGAVVRSLPGEPVRVFVRAGYEREFDDDARTLTMTPTGAPIRFTSSVERADRNYMSYAMGVDGQVAGALSLRAGVAGYALRDDRDSVTAFAGLSAAF
ncbi:Phospholipase/lecithinase/hemolysin [Sphingomonas sp. T1]|uniref:autotransporter domain-containing protein n=1 Tax=Sphingomonas sp. T1 TaxID=2653172 RepID=UPI0012F01851|nr:autotransporter domain-containing protein [Sphingomonas sp. T1]VXD02598.1 Phospholipase/lecithinase/hemolysin [Sphingomonas sp. T1]